MRVILILLLSLFTGPALAAEPLVIGVVYNLTGAWPPSTFPAWRA